MLTLLRDNPTGAIYVGAIANLLLAYVAGYRGAVLRKSLMVQSKLLISARNKEFAIGFCKVIGFSNFFLSLIFALVGVNYILPDSSAGTLLVLIYAVAMLLLYLFFDEIFS